MAEINVKAISQTGMAFERARIEAASLNIARANTISSEASKVAPLFTAALSNNEFNKNGLLPEQVSIHSEVRSKAVYDPSHAMANTQGFIFMPDIDLASEMLTLSSAKRAYEANVKVYNTYKDMSSSALLIGK
jgi:flagellar basal-body rod protein FlgC